jgi:hypothetical protein
MRHSDDSSLFPLGWLFPVLLLLSALTLGMRDPLRPHAFPTAEGCMTAMRRVHDGPLAPLPPNVDFVVTANLNQQWVVNGVVQPTLALTRGRTYQFDLTAFGDEHPFLINSNANDPFGTIYLPAVSSQVITFTPNFVMPSTIYYHCEVHYSMGGAINLVRCTGDLNNDLVVNSTDFGIFVGAFGTTCAGCLADLNGNGVVHSTDFGIFVGAFGSNCN